MEANINRDRKIGIEVEFVLPIVGNGSNIDVQRLVATVLSREGLPSVAREYSHAPVPEFTFFCIEHDGSLRDEQRFQGIRWAHLELKTAPMTWGELERILPKALEIVSYLGARCNPSTGFHVHHHLPEIIERPQISKSLQHFWWAYHKILYGMIAPSRLQSQYCQPPRHNAKSLFDNVRTYADFCTRLRTQDRYNGLNLLNLAVRDRMTVEWRIHNGTISFEKIKGWVLATQRFTEHAINRNVQLRDDPIPNSRAGLNSLLIATGLKPNSRIYNKVEKDLRQVGKWCLRRWRHFNRDSHRQLKEVAA